MTQCTDKSILNVRQLLQLQNVTIPPYQRPYKWTLKNVSHLFQDIQTQQDKSAYRLGSVVFHGSQEHETERLDIVDGQQRTLTLMLAVKAIIDTRLVEPHESNKLDRKDLRDQLRGVQPAIESFMKRQTFSSAISQNNLHQNYLEAKRLVSRSDFTESHIDFLLNRCEVVVFKLNVISEAFQFFDSQNARGRDLEPHDLLKAFHLREFPEHESDLKAATVADWEALQSDVLAKLFADYLYRIRQWAHGKSARAFGKNQVDEFKGVNLDKVGHFPYVESLRITHHFVDDYNSQYQRKIDGQCRPFPFYLDQMVINGRRFFEMAVHYEKKVKSIVNSEHDLDKTLEHVPIDGVELNDSATGIIRTLNDYDRRTRIGDRYVRSVFDCAVVFYMDKFGTAHLSTAIEKLFIWAYRCRIKQQVVQVATVDNYVLANNIFLTIKDATLPSDVLSYALKTMKASDNKNNRRGNAENDPLVKLFKEMKYYE